MHEKLLNIKEVAESLGLSEEEIKDLVSKGKIPAYKIGGILLRFKKEQIDQYKRRADSSGADEQFSQSKDWRALVKQEEAVSYSFLERLEDFLYYNDFYILSLILLALVLFAILEI